MDNLEVIARFKIRAGRLGGFTGQVAEILRLTRDADKHTLRCDWFVNDDGTECEVHELFPDEQGLIEHKMNTMEATGVLFSDFAFDHHSTIYGEVSQGFVDLVAQRMGPPSLFSLFEGIPVRTPLPRSLAGTLELTAAMRVRPGQLEGVKRQMAEIVRLTRERDTKTVRYDVFLKDDGTACEVHEAYLGEEGLIEHNDHVLEARNILFREYAFDHRMSVYAGISQELTDLANKHAGGIRKFALLQGLEADAVV